MKVDLVFPVGEHEATFGTLTIRNKGFGHSIVVGGRTIVAHGFLYTARH